MILTTDWPYDFGLPADIVKGGLCSSGMYDLKAVRLSARSNYVAFDDETALVHHADIERGLGRACFGGAQQPAGAGLRILGDARTLDEAAGEFLHRRHVVGIGARAQILDRHGSPLGRRERLGGLCRRRNGCSRRKYWSAMRLARTLVE